MKKIIAGIAGAVIAISLTGCNMPPPPAGDDDCYVVATGQEVEDDACEDGQDGYVWGADNGEHEEDDDDDDHIIVFGGHGHKTHKPSKRASQSGKIVKPGKVQTQKFRSR